MSVDKTDFDDQLYFAACREMRKTDAHKDIQAIALGVLMLTVALTLAVMTY